MWGAEEERERRCVGWSRSLQRGDSKAAATHRAPASARSHMISSWRARRCRFGKLRCPRPIAAPNQALCHWLIAFTPRNYSHGPSGHSDDSPFMPV